MSGTNQFRVVVGSYEHNLLCLSLDLSTETPLFTPIFHFEAHSLSVKCLDVSNKYLVSGSNDEHIRIYDLKKRKELGTLLAHQGSITALRFSRSEHEGKITHKWLLSASEDNKIIIWRVKDWENLGVLKGHTARINDIDIHPSNRVAVSVSDDHSIRLWNLMSVKKAAVLKLRNYNENGQMVRWIGEGNYFAVALSRKILIYDTTTAKVCHEIEIANRKIIMHMECETLGEHHDSEYLCIGLNDGSVQFFHTYDFLASRGDDDDKHPTEPEFSLQGHSNRVKDFTFFENTNDKYLITTGSDGRVVVWSMGNKEQVAVYDCGERLNCLVAFDEAVEKSETMRKRNANDIENAEQSEAENDDEELRKVMFGEAKKASTKSQKKRERQKKKKKISIELE